jgi:hypothetical protein
MQRHFCAADTHSRLHIPSGRLLGLPGLLPHGVWRCQTSILQRFAVAQRTTTLKGIVRAWGPGEAAGPV